VASRVTDGQEDRPVELEGPPKSLLSPRVPIHGIVGMLPEIRALLVDKAIGASLSSA
jgi:hypothetical protein